MKIIALAFIFFASGCSHQKTTSQEFSFPYAQELLTKIQSDVGKKIISQKTEDMKIKSPRRVYFSALFNQYQTLGHFLKKEKNIHEIISCPQFHHDKTLLEVRPVLDLKFFKTTDVLGPSKDYFPEAVFVTKTSLEQYYQTIREELDSLCEDGASDNFFKFDNLITHYANKSSFHLSPRAMSSVLKIPVFANLYLINMISPNGVVAISDEEKGLIELTRTYWFEDYVLKASLERKTLLQQAMALGGR